VTRDSAQAIARDLGTVIVRNQWSPGPEFNPAPRPGEFALDDVQRRIVRQFCVQPSVQQAPHAAEIGGFFARFFGEATFLHPIFYPRVGPPSRANLRDVTAPHQDYLHVQGSLRTTTVWLALTSCGGHDSGLQFAEGSHTGTLHPRADLAKQEIHDGLAWLAPHYEPGDALLFHALTIHRAQANRSDRFRLSIDFRIQPLAEPICDESISTSYPNGIPWETIYGRISDPDIRYYWKRRSPNTIVPFDRAIANTRTPLFL
jgi:hypothetical protein